MQKAQDKLLTCIEKTVFLCLIMLIVLPSLVSGQEFYQFERMWPTLTQPWYFNNPQGMAITPDGPLYVVDSNFLRIRKFTQDGYFITSWGSEGIGEGEFGSCELCTPQSGPKDIAVGIEGNVYVTDTYNHRIQKFTSDGVYLDEWGEVGISAGQFQFPWGIATDARGYVYVSDYENHRIQKFTSTGTFVTKWGRNEGDGSYGAGDGEFWYPSSVTLDSSGFVYVCDHNNLRIQKFTSDGTFISKWDNLFPGGARFANIQDISTDGNSNIYVTDKGGGFYEKDEYVIYPPSIHKIGLDGQLIERWEHPVYPSGIAANENYVYVTNVTSAAYGITKLTVEGTVVNVWDSYEIGEDKLRLPEGIAVSGDGKLYVTDNLNNRMHIYTKEGIQISPPWGESGSDDGQFQDPRGVAVDGSGNVYVCDRDNNRIQKFASNGQIITTWGRDDGLINHPRGIALDSAGNVYITDSFPYTAQSEPYSRIQKFIPNPSGTLYTLERMWDEWAGEKFNSLFGIAVGKDASATEYVYVTDKTDFYVHKFTLDGQYVTTWTGPEEGMTLNLPQGIATDGSGNVYLADSGNYRVLKFTSEGDLVASFGTPGSSPGQMGEVHYIAVDDDEKVYVADRYNNRIQVFAKVEGVGNSKAVIVAGGGPYEGNNLWDATQMTASFAYRTLLHQGFTNDDIFYLSADSNLDIDGDGVSDVYGDATSENLKMILEDLSEDEEVDGVLLYLTDHGGEDTFRMSGDEILYASNNVDNPGHDLASWLDVLTSKRVTVVYDACQSGSFIDDLEGDDRIIITSSGSDEQAKFLNQGTISFSHFFWTDIFSGSSLSEAYEDARDAVNIISDQTPDIWWDTLNIELENAYIGNHVKGMIGDAPRIEGEILTSPDYLTIENSAVLSVNGVVDPNNDAITRVWAVIWPPDYETGPTDDPLLGLPMIDLYPAGESTYAAPFNEFHSIGNYRVTIYAMDEHGNTSPPKDTILSRNLSRKAIIIAGGAGPGITPQMIDHNAQLAYHTLISQHYDPNDEIYFMSVKEDIPGFDDKPSSEELNTYLQGLLTEGEMENLDLTIYFIGGIDDEAFILNDNQDEYETLSASQLDAALQTLKPGRVTVICDFDRSGSFIREHTLPEGSQRITITSTGDENAAYFNNEGNISFSSFFWSQVAGGATVGEAFIYANKAIAYCIRKNDISFSCYSPQSPLLDANNNGIPNEQEDYDLMKGIKIGDGIVAAADPPIIGSVSVLRAGEMITIIGEDITSTLPIERVWAVLRPIRYCPGTSEADFQEIEEVDLPGPDSEGKYVVDYLADYACTVTVYAKSLDADGEPNISMAEGTKIHREGGDIYEPDDRSANANVIVVNHSTPQPHTFDDPDDVDWVKFYGVAGKTYVIEAINLGANCPVIALYKEEDREESIDGISEHSVVGDKAWFDFPCGENGIYYVKLFWGGCTWEDVMRYDLQIHDGNVGLTAIVRGKVRDHFTGKGIDGAVIRSSGVGATISTHGEYILSEIPGNWTLRARKSGYTTAVAGIKIDSQDQQIRKDIRMAPQNISCIEDADCDDGEYCNGVEVCLDETCQPGTDPCGDDGLYCNGEEVGCDEENEICEHSASPCPGHQACIEEKDECVDKECATNEDCDDGRFCNGTEICAGGFCQAGTNPCSEPTPVCDEEQDICVEGPTIQLFPNPQLQLRWMPLLMFLRIVGTNTHFDSSSSVHFDPPGTVMDFPPILGDEKHLFMIGLVMPTWLAPTQLVNVKVKTGSEILSEVLNFHYFPFLLREKGG